jgi:hypothetical protein
MLDRVPYDHAFLPDRLNPDRRRARRIARDRAEEARPTLDRLTRIAGITGARIEDGHLEDEDGAVLYGFSLSLTVERAVSFERVREAFLRDVAYIDVLE